MEHVQPVSAGLAGQRQKASAALRIEPAMPDSVWDAYVAAHPAGSLYHQSRWGICSDTAASIGSPGKASGWRVFFL